MKIHEYQGKAILRKYGVAVPRGRMVKAAKKRWMRRGRYFKTAQPASS
jgi:succinyl-CoA synthetase beta subunit